VTTRLDTAGQLKMATLEEALTQLQRLHSIVEHMAVAVRGQQDAGQLRQQLQRAARPMVGLLKQQFESIADQVSNMVLVSSRGGGEQARLRAQRECVAQIRTQVEATMARVREVHRDDRGTRAPGTS
jgi:hypothetical protein